MWKKGKQYFSQWATEEQRKSGFTMPINPRFPAWRPDHLIYQSKLKKEAEIQDEIEIIGDFTLPPFEEQRFDSIAKDNQVRTPSDHFGLMARIGL